MGCGGSVAHGNGAGGGMGRSGDDKQLTSTEVQTISIKPGRSGDGGSTDADGGAGEVVSGRKGAGQSSGPAGAANGLTSTHGGGSGTGSGKLYAAGTATVTGGGGGGGGANTLAPPDLPNTLGSPHGLVGQWNAAFAATGGSHIAAAATAGGIGTAASSTAGGGGKDCVALFDARSPYHNPRYDVAAPHNSEFLSVLAADATRKLFTEFLAKSYCDFQITFCEEVQRFRQLYAGVGFSPAAAGSTATTAATAAGSGSGALTLAVPSGSTGGAGSNDSGVHDTAHDRAIRERADHIYAQYIRVGAPMQVNLIQSVKANIDLLFAVSKQTPVAGGSSGPTAAQPPLTARGSLSAPLIPGARVPVSVFDEAEFVILELVKGNFYFTFVKTPEYLRHQQLQAAAHAHGRTSSLAARPQAFAAKPDAGAGGGTGSGGGGGDTATSNASAGARDKGCVIA